MTRISEIFEGLEHRAIYELLSELGLEVQVDVNVAPQGIDDVEG